MQVFIVRVLIVYLALLLATKIMGKREIGQLAAIDFVVSILMADLAALPITHHDISVWQALAPLGVVTLLQVVTSILCMKSNRFRRFIYGKPNVLIAHGHMQLGEMRKARYNIDDLLTQLRQRDVFDISDVDYAVLETSGDLTVALKTPKQAVTRDDLRLPETEGGLALTLIDDGEVNHRGLADADLDEAWLQKRLARQGVFDVKDVFFASLSSDGSLYLMKRQDVEEAIPGEQEIH